MACPIIDKYNRTVHIVVRKIVRAKQDQKLGSYDIALQAAQSKSRLKMIENLDRLIFAKVAN